MSSVSIIIPTYNRAHLLSDAIESIFNQTFKNYKIIVVDDGSTDSTRSVLNRYGDSIKYIRQENKGAGAARNRGLKEVDTEYVAFLDSDDLWFDFKLELQVGIMERLPQIGFLFSDFCILKAHGNNIKYGLKTWHREVKSWEDIYNKKIKYSTLKLPMIAPEKDFSVFIGNLYYPLLKEPYVLPSSSIVRRDCLDENIRFTEGVPLYEDWEFFAFLSRKYDSAFLDIETVFNRGHKDEVRLTHCGPIIHAENRLKIIERVWKSDELFFKNNRQEIKEVEGIQYELLVKEYLFASKPKIARKFISHWEKLGLSNDRYKMIFYKVIATFPGGCKLLLALQYIRKLFR